MASDSHKRAAPADFEPLDGSGRPPPALRDSAPHDPLASDRGGSQPINVRDSILYPELSQELLDAASGGWMGELSKRLERAEADGDGGSNVVLSPAEARSLLHTMQQKLGGFLATPATKADILALIIQLSHNVHRALGSKPPPASLFASLPYDVLRLIFLELRELYIRDEDIGPYFIGRRGLHGWWQLMRQLAPLSPGLHEVCGALYRSELVINDIKTVPSRAELLHSKPERGAQLRSMTISSYDWDHNLRDAEDAGFALPDLVEAAPNLHSLVLASERASTFVSSQSTLRSRSASFLSLMGGVNLSTTITTSLRHLRTLVYNAPCAFTDVIELATALPTLESLDVLGDVEHTRPADLVLRHVSPTLRRLWLPSTKLTAADVSTLLDALAEEQTVRVTALAFTFDPEDFFALAPPSDDAIVHELADLLTTFSFVGPDLREFAISTPAADNPDAGRIRLAPAGLFGPPGGPGAGNGVMITFALAGMGGGGGGAGAGGAGAAGAAPPPAPANGAQPQFAAHRRAPQAGAAGAGGVQGGAGGAGGARGAAPPQFPPFNIFNPATWLPGGGGGGGGGGGAAGGGGPGGNNAAGGPAGGAGGANNNPPGPINNLPGLVNIPGMGDPVPFFDELVDHLRHVEHLELYGRRYDASLINSLRELPLRHLALSVPGDEAREPVTEGLLTAMQECAWPCLRRIELSGRGGEWAASQRRRVKKVAEKREGVVYRSTDVKP
ncbi:hypothetical protein Rhopal_003251-T1 [Rhodotorula paludigena]|uniref:F-box domain-containing protein n=1 Tax=Rhodotorula paludigena TaxID=86838 RepID=A0AAV5GLL1_9BASI|nr:hypothetical protein Rhopal_003251-T1 [Rhodotorula paludigena]